MIRILLTEIDDCLGNAFDDYIKDTCIKEICVDRVFLQDDAYLDADWTGYDAVIHAARVVVPIEKDNVEHEALQCYSINHDLSVKVADKAKASAIKRFVYLSTMMVYGESAPIGRSFVIRENTVPEPISSYGKSMLAAEEDIAQIASDSFQVIILREPVVYGEHFNGEFYKLHRIARILPIFPMINSAKSYIYERNLCELLKLMAIDGSSGVYCPQNREIVTTSELFRQMRYSYGKKCLLVKGLDSILSIMSHITRYVNATFNDMNYESGLSDIPGMDYQVYSLEESILRCLK